MVAVKMFLDMWRNLTSATTNWSFSGSGGGNTSNMNGSSKGSSRQSNRTRYNRLRTGPPKSHSQPANLISLATEESPSSLTSLETSVQRNGKGETTTSFSIQEETGKRGKTLIGMKNSYSTPFPSVPVIATALTPFAQQSRVETKLGPRPPPQPPIHSDNAQRSSWHFASNNNNQDQEYVSDLDDEVDRLTCDVCDRAFPTLKQLADHQRKKRHYGCLQCDSIFPSREVLEYHREQMDHYDYAIHYEDEGSNTDDSFETDDDENGFIDSDDCDDEERERLL